MHTLYRFYTILWRIVVSVGHVFDPICWAALYRHVLLGDGVGLQVLRRDLSHAHPQDEDETGEHAHEGALKN